MQCYFVVQNQCKQHISDPVVDLGGFFLATLLDLGFGSGGSETGPWYAGRSEDGPTFGYSWWAWPWLLLSLFRQQRSSPSRQSVPLRVQG